MMAGVRANWGATCCAPTNESRRRKATAAEGHPCECLVFIELVAFAVGHYGDADGDGHGRDHQDEDAAAQSSDEALAGACGLGVAESAILRAGQGGEKQGA